MNLEFCVYFCLSRNGLMLFSHAIAYSRDAYMKIKLIAEAVAAAAAPAQTIHHAVSLSLLILEDELRRLVEGKFCIDMKNL